MSDGDRVIGNGVKGTFIDGDLVPGKDFDEVDVTYPSPTQEVFVYIKLPSTIVRTVTLDYIDSCRNDLLKATYT